MFNTFLTGIGLNHKPGAVQKTDEVRVTKTFQPAILKLDSLPSSIPPTKTIKSEQIQHQEHVFMGEIGKPITQKSEVGNELVTQLKQTSDRMDASINQCLQKLGASSSPATTKTDLNEIQLLKQKIAKLESSPLERAQKVDRDHRLQKQTETSKQKARLERDLARTVLSGSAHNIRMSTGALPLN